MKELLTPSRVAFAFAGAFLLATLLGFVPNPLVGPDALFETNTAHNLVHLATAIGFIAFGFAGESASTKFMRVFGVTYLGVGVLGFLTLGEANEGMLLGVVHINALDNYLHLGLGAAILAAGLWVTPRVASAATSPTVAKSTPTSPPA